MTPQSDRQDSEIAVSLSADEKRLVGSLTQMMRGRRDVEYDAAIDVLERVFDSSREFSGLGEDGVVERLLDLAVEGLGLLDGDELKKARGLADSIAAKLVLACGSYAGSAHPWTDEERKNLYRAGLGQEIVFSHLLKEQARLVVAEALAFAAIMDLEVSVSDRTVEPEDFNDSALDFLALELRIMKNPILRFVDSDTGGRPNKQAGYIKIEKAGSFLGSYAAFLEVDSKSAPLEAIDSAGLREALVSLGQECRTASQKWHAVRGELAPYARYISRTVGAGGELREALSDLVRSDPETPLKAAISRVLAAESPAAQATAETRTAPNEYVSDFFRILAYSLADPELKGAIAASLEAFYERVLAVCPKIVRYL